MSLARCSLFTISDLGCTPTMRSISRPAFSTRRVGIVRTWNREAVNGFLSTSILAIRTRPSISEARSSITSATTDVAPHQIHIGHIGLTRSSRRILDSVPVICELLAEILPSITLLKWMSGAAASSVIDETSGDRFFPEGDRIPVGPTFPPDIRERKAVFSAESRTASM